MMELVIVPSAHYMNLDIFDSFYENSLNKIMETADVVSIDPVLQYQPVEKRNPNYGPEEGFVFDPEKWEKIVLKRKKRKLRKELMSAETDLTTINLLNKLIEKGKPLFFVNREKGEIKPIRKQYRAEAYTLAKAETSRRPTDEELKRFYDEVNKYAGKIFDHVRARNRKLVDDVSKLENRIRFEIGYTNKRKLKDPLRVVYFTNNINYFAMELEETHKMSVKVFVPDALGTFDVLVAGILESEVFRRGNKKYAEIYALTDLKRFLDTIPEFDLGPHSETYEDLFRKKPKLPITGVYACLKYYSADAFEAIKEKFMDNEKNFKELRKVLEEIKIDEFSRGMIFELSLQIEGQIDLVRLENNNPLKDFL